MIPNLRYWSLLFFIVLVYITGMFVTLFENDSAQFAVMAMRMVQENDFLSLFKGPNEYLDKPHMHYWLAALSFKIFGIHDWAYRIPGILAVLLGAYSCYGLGKLLYNTDTGKLAALVFMTAQTIMLSAIDVRTDAVLTGFTIFAIWHLTAYIEKRKLVSIVLGAFGAGIAFSTKGQIALLVIGLPLLCHLAYTRKWEAFLNWRVLVALMVFGMAIAPMLYAYYIQFDLHPEKIIRGKSNRSGILFIFWEQSFERLSGDGMGKNSSDYTFFFHTFLWVFLPWTVLGLVAYWQRIRTFVKLKFAYRPKYEFLTLGGIALIFVIISFAQFKLPHYLNITMPLFAILTASYMHGLYRSSKRKMMKTLLAIQHFILSLVFITVVLVFFFVFKPTSTYMYFLFVALCLAVTYFCLKREGFHLRIITISVCSSLLLNVVLNVHFYPSLLNYQAGSTIAKKIADDNMEVENIYKLTDDHTWSLDFYTKKPVKAIDKNKIDDLRPIWLYVNGSELDALHNLGFDWDKQVTAEQFRITRLQVDFLNLSTRKKVMDHRHLIHIH